MITFVHIITDNCYGRDYGRSYNILKFVGRTQYSTLELLTRCVSRCRAGAMKAQGGEEESHFDSGQECEDDALERYFAPECRVVVPPPSHG